MLAQRGETPWYSAARRTLPGSAHVDFFTGFGKREMRPPQGEISTISGCRLRLDLLAPAGPFQTLHTRTTAARRVGYVAGATEELPED